MTTSIDAPLTMSKRVQIGLQNYATVTGWATSAEMRQAIGPSGEPVPWYTYSAIYFLTGRVRPEMRVFEYGSGNSTLWWAARVATVVACEHDAKWFSIMSSKMPANVTYLRRDLADGYAAAILESDTMFDVVVVDGRDRVASCSAGLQRLKPNGVVIWDNAERRRYTAGYKALADAGFRRLPFRGHGPINGKEWETAVFYRNDNCFGI
jgi:precorrin-6B methylase 2